MYIANREWFDILNPSTIATMHLKEKNWYLFLERWQVTFELVQKTIYITINEQFIFFFKLKLLIPCNSWKLADKTNNNQYHNGIIILFLSYSIFYFPLVVLQQSDWMHHTEVSGYAMLACTDLSDVDLNIAQHLFIDYCGSLAFVFSQ